MRAALSASLVVLALVGVAFGWAPSASAQTVLDGDVKAALLNEGLAGVLLYVTFAVIGVLFWLLYRDGKAHKDEIKDMAAQQQQWATKVTEVMGSAISTIKACTDALNANAASGARHEASLARSVERLEESGRLHAATGSQK